MPIDDGFDPGSDWGRVPSPAAATLKRQMNSDAEGTCSICGATKDLVCDDVKHRQVEYAAAFEKATQATVDPTPGLKKLIKTPEHPLFNNRFFRLYALHEGRTVEDQWSWDQRSQHPAQSFIGWLNEYWRIYGKQMGVIPRHAPQEIQPELRDIMQDEFFQWLLYACHQKQPGERMYYGDRPTPGVTLKRAGGYDPAKGKDHPDNQDPTLEGADEKIMQDLVGMGMPTELKVEIHIDAGPIAAQDIRPLMSKYAAAIAVGDYPHDIVGFEVPATGAVPGKLFLRRGRQPVPPGAKDLLEEARETEHFFNEMLEAAYWRFDSLRSGDAHKLEDGTKVPKAERDAFKMAVRGLIDKMKEGRQKKG